MFPTKDQMQETARAAWNADALTCFETRADLFFARFGVLAPGKSEPLEFSGGSDDDKRAAMADWANSGLMAVDLTIALARSLAREQELRARLEDLS
jgi:hypothetical protein